MKNRNPAESKDTCTMGQPVSNKLDGLNGQRKMNHKDILPDLFDNPNKQQTDRDSHKVKISAENHPDVLSQILNTFSEGHDYTIINYQILSHGQSNSNAYQVYLRADIHNKETAIKWWEDYNKKTQITMKVAKIFPHSGKINLFKIQLRCQHNTRCKVKDIPKTNDKNTQCPAIITITVKKHIPSSKEDPLSESHPATIDIYFSHNHPIYCADVLRHRPLASTVEKKIHELFYRGYSPATALDTYKLELQIQNPQEYENLSGDGSICPNLSKMYRLYYSHTEQSFGPANGKGMFDTLEEAIQKYNSENSGKDGKMHMVPFEKEAKKNLIVAICTPLMARVHNYY